MRNGYKKLQIQSYLPQITKEVVIFLIFNYWTIGKFDSSY